MGREMLSLQLSKDASKGSNVENKEKWEKKRLRIVQLNEKEVFWVSLFTGDEGRGRELKVREAGKQGTGHKTFWTPLVPSPHSIT